MKKRAVQLKRSPPRVLSLSAQICHAIKSQIVAQIYLPGVALPSSRALAAELGVSRSTVTAAFEQLAAEGYLQMSQGSRPRVPDALQRPRAGPGASVQKRPARTQISLSAFAQRLAAFAPAERLKGLAVDFRSGDLAGVDFPEIPWRRAISLALSQPSPTLRYDDPLGSLPLRKSLRAYLWRSRGVRCDEQQIVVVNGSQQGIDMCARLLLDGGDRAVVEDPGYTLARHAFEALGATTLPIPVDHDGMKTDLLGGVVAKLAYVTPSHQFPLGGILPVSRRQQLLSWSRRTQAFVIEDDYDGEYRYDTKPTETLHSLDPEGRVIYMGTLSKTLSPELRLGYLVIPSELIAPFALAKRLTDRHTALLQQKATQLFIDSGALERHIRKIRRFNAKRRQSVLAHVEAQLGDQATVAGAAAGLHVVLWLNGVPRHKEDEVIAAAGRRGLGIYGISPLYRFLPTRQLETRAGLVLGYAALTELQIAKGLKMLADLLSQLFAGH